MAGSLFAVCHFLCTLRKGGLILLTNHDLENDISYFIVHWFQPVYHLTDNNTIGYEALLRDASSLKTSHDKISI